MDVAEWKDYMTPLTKNEQAWMEKYFEKRICELEKRIADKFESNETHFHALNEWRSYITQKDNTYFTCKEHEMFKDSVNIRIGNLEKYDAKVEGKASMGAVILSYLIGITGLIIAIINMVNK